MAEVFVSFVFERPLDAVWRILRDFNSLTSWWPAVSQCEIENGLAADQIGAIRKFSLRPDGAIVRERLLALSDRDHSYSYLLLDGPLPVQNLVGKFRLYKITESGNTFGYWRATFDVSERDRPATVEQLTSLYAGGWSNLKKIMGAQTAPP